MRLTIWVSLCLLISRPGSLSGSSDSPGLQLRSLTDSLALDSASLPQSPALYKQYFPLSASQPPCAPQLPSGEWPGLLFAPHPPLLSFCPCLVGASQSPSNPDYIGQLGPVWARLPGPGPMRCLLGMPRSVLSLLRSGAKGERLPRGYTRPPFGLCLVGRKEVAGGHQGMEKTAPLPLPQTSAPSAA